MARKHTLEALLRVVAVAWIVTGFAAPALAQTNEEATAPDPVGVSTERIDALERQVERLEADLLTTRVNLESRLPQISGRSTLVFTSDLLTGGTALTNDNEINIRVGLAGGTATQRHRADQFFATISFFRFDISATEDGVEVTQGQVDARLHWNNYYMLISQAPEFLLDKAPPVETFEANVRTNSVVAEGGFAIGTEGRGRSLELRVGSFRDDARLNFQNRYGFGLDWRQRVIPQRLNIEAGATYGMQLGYIRDENSTFTSRDIGVSVKPILLFRGLGQGIRVNLATDVLFPYDVIEEAYGTARYDARIDTELFLSDEGVLDDGSRARSSVRVAAYTVPQDQVLDLEARIIELPGDLGFLPVFGGNLTVVLADVLRPETFNTAVGGRVDVTFGAVTPYVESTFRTVTNRVGLTVGTLVKPIEKVRFEVAYESRDVLERDSTIDGALGEFRLSTTILY